MVRRFLLHCLLLGVPVIVMLAAWCSLHARYFPPPHFTNNLSLNMNLAAFDRKGGRQAEVLAIGSSMTFNNLSSREVVARFGDRYFNLGAWGMDMLQANGLARVMVTRSKASTVIMVSNLMDFSRDSERSAIDFDALAGRRHFPRDFAAYLTSPELVYYLRHMETNRTRYTDRGNYECLMLDEHGGVVLDVPPERILDSRWNIPPPSAASMDAAQYDALRGMGACLCDQGIQMIFIQAPYRDGIRTPESDSLTAAHVARVRAMLEPMGHVVVDATRRSWPDDMFCDSSHLNGEAVHAFTRYALDQWEAADRATGR